MSSVPIFLCYSRAMSTIYMQGYPLYATAEGYEGTHMVTGWQTPSDEGLGGVVVVPLDGAAELPTGLQMIFHDTYEHARAWHEQERQRVPRSLQPPKDDPKAETRADLEA